MAASVPVTAPPMAEALVEWAEEHADRVEVAADRSAGTYEVTAGFERERLRLVGVLGQDGDPGLWESATLAVREGVTADAALGFPRQLPEPPVVVADDGTLTLQTLDGEITLSPHDGGDAAADDAGDRVADDAGDGAGGYRAAGDAGDGAAGSDADGEADGDRRVSDGDGAAGSDDEASGG